MIIDRFGDTYAGAFQLPQLQANDDWGAERPAIVSQVSGASGAFDHYGSDNYPISPLSISKSFTLSGSSYSNVGTLETALRAATIAADRSKLWGLWRDGTTRVWTWAKCAGLTMPRTSEGEFTTIPGQLTFFASEGLWYSESEQTTTFLNFAASPFNFNVTNSGNYPALARTTIATSGSHTADALSNAVSGWSSTTSWDNTNAFVIDAAVYSATFGATDIYSTFSPDAGQIAWLWLAPGVNAMVYTYTGNAGTIKVEHFHTYVL